MGDRDHLGRFAAGNKLAPAGGFNPREIRARRALKLKLAESAAAAGEVIDQTIKGDDPKAALDASKFVTDHIVGKPRSS